MTATGSKIRFTLQDLSCVFTGFHTTHAMFHFMSFGMLMARDAGIHMRVAHRTVEDGGVGFLG